MKTQNPNCFKGSLITTSLGNNTPWASLGPQLVKNSLAMWETWVGKIPWRRERLLTPVFWPREFHGQSMGLQRVGHD